MENLQKAINYETIVNATHFSDARAIPLYKHISEWCNISDPLSENLEVYTFLTGCDEDVLFKAQCEVVRAFENLSVNVEIICPDSQYWPIDVKETQFLYLKGDKSLLRKPSISIVGTRQATENGIKITGESVDKLGSEYVIVSGLAKGIDCAAHIQSLKKGFKTIAVIGTSISSCYPPEHKELQDFISEHGLVVSQFAPSRRTQQYFFIQRNLTMSEISKGSLLIESSDEGGGVKQALYSQNQGKPVFIFKETYDNPNLKWPKKFKSPVVVNDISCLAECVKNPIALKPVQSLLFD